MTVLVLKSCDHSYIQQEISQFIKESGEAGFILVSFGSSAKIIEAPAELRNIFYTAFRNSKTRFVWKWDGPRPAEMPDNVITAEWLPQQDILGMTLLPRLILLKFIIHKKIGEPGRIRSTPFLDKANPA